MSLNVFTSWKILRKMQSTFFGQTDSERIQKRRKTQTFTREWPRFQFYIYVHKLTYSVPQKKNPILLKTKSTVRIVYKFYNNSAPRQIKRNCQISNHYVESLGYRSNLTRPNLVGFLPSTSVYICHIYKAPSCHWIASNMISSSGACYHFCSRTCRR